MVKEQVIHGDCLKVMKTIDDNSIDMILCDLPYGTTACGWDIVIPFDKLWEQYKRIVKENAAIVLFATQPFTADLINSNRDWFKYTWVWDKVLHSNPLLGNIQPLRLHEDIVVFYKKQPTYNPQKTVGKKRRAGGSHTSETKGKAKIISKGNEEGLNKPTSIITFSNASKKGIFHPTQKPNALCEYLIKTYTNKGDLVLDNAAGSGTTGRAAKDCGRNFILIEKEPKYIEVIKKRLQQEVLF